MKKSNIAVFFKKHEEKKIATHIAPPTPISDIDEELSIPIEEN